MTDRRFDAVVFDAGGVLVLPDPTVIGPLLAYFGGDDSIDVHRRAHYSAMKAKDDAHSPQESWDEYNSSYVVAVGVPEADREEAAAMLARTRYHATWRWVIPESRAALDLLFAASVPMGVISNASGQIEAMLAREICQVGPGPHVPMRIILDSHVVGIAKPDPAIFELALLEFSECDRSRIAYVGDSVTIDVAGSTLAGMHPILLDPYNDYDRADFERIASLYDLAEELTVRPAG